MKHLIDEFNRVHHDPKIWKKNRSGHSFVSEDQVVMFQVYQGLETTRILSGLIIEQYHFHESLDKVDTRVVEWLNTRRRP